MLFQTVGTDIKDDHNMNVPRVTQSFHYFGIFELDFIWRVYDYIDVSREFANYFMNPAKVRRFLD